MILYHAVAKFLPNVTGGMPLKKQLGVYVASLKKKYKVNFVAFRKLTSSFLLCVKSHPSNIYNYAIFFIQNLIETYYELQYKFTDFVKDLEVEKIAGDELTVLLLCKYL